MVFSFLLERSENRRVSNPLFNEEIYIRKEWRYEIICTDVVYARCGLYGVYL